MACGCGGVKSPRQNWASPLTSPLMYRRRKLDVDKEHWDTHVQDRSATWALSDSPEQSNLSLYYSMLGS